MFSGYSIYQQHRPWLVLLVCLACSQDGSKTVATTSATALPTDVQLSGAIVAAVAEEDAVREQADEQQRQQAQDHLNWLALERMYTALQGRGKLHKQRKMLKYLYPLLVGVILAKVVLIPLVLKMLTALSTTSFVMSKIALVASGLLALRWIFAMQASEKTHFEIVHVPRPHIAGIVASGGGGGGVGGGGAGAWEDLTLSGSNLLELAAKQPPRQKYIPIMSGGGGSGSTAERGTGMAVHGSAIYRYPQHNYVGAAYDGKPFL